MLTIAVNKSLLIPVRLGLDMHAKNQDQLVGCVVTYVLLKLLKVFKCNFPIRNWIQVSGQQTL